MVSYECKRCGYFTNHKGNFKNHVNRKNICPILLEDVSMEYVKKMNNLENSKISTKIHQNGQNHPPKSTKMENSTTKIHQNEEKMANNLKCLHCNKFFCRSDSLKRHYDRCKIKKKNMEKENNCNNKLKEENIELKNAVKDLRLELKHKQCINNTTNNINVLIMNNYGEENIKYSKKYLTGIIKGAFSAIPKLIEDTHFNKNYPENSNIRITNKKLPYAEVRKNGKWELQDKESFIELLVDDKYYILEDHYNEMDKSNLSEFQKDIIENFKTKYTSSDDDLMKTLKKKTELVILNKSK